MDGWTDGGRKRERECTSGESTTHKRQRRHWRHRNRVRSNAFKCVALQSVGWSVRGCNKSLCPSLSPSLAQLLTDAFKSVLQSIVVVVVQRESESERDDTHTHARTDT